MTGTIVTRTLKDGSKRYIAVWRVDGKQKWKTFNRQKDAQRFLAGAVKATHDGAYQDIEPVSMGAALDRWLTHSLDVRVKQGKLKPSTAKSYRSMLETHLRPAFGEIRSDRLRHANIEDWVRDRSEEIAEGTLSPKFYNNLLNLLHVILGWARRQGFLVHDPLDGVERLPRAKVERAFLEPHEIASLLNSVTDVRDGTILMTAVYSGLRRGELFGLQWRDIDFAFGRISVRRSVYQGHITTPKTDSSIRQVDVPSSVLACMSIYRAYYPAIGEGFVFRTVEGQPIDSDNWTKRSFSGIQKNAEGVPTIGLHGLRHSYASLLINQGEQMKYVSRQLGHASIQITADLYGHLFRETSTAAMQRLDARMNVADAQRGQVVQLRTGTQG